MIEPYFAILVFLGIGVFLGIAPLVIAWLLAVHRPDPNKNAPYECGFPAFENARKPFDVRFYLVAILFIIFDLETAFLFPWAVSLRKLGFAGFIAMVIFLLLLTIGFIYEWRKGALEWE